MTDDSPPNRPLDLKGSSRRLWRAARMVWEAGPGLAAGSIALTLLQGILPLLSLYLMKLLVDAVAAGVTDSAGGSAFRHILLLVGLAVAAGLVSSLFGAAASYVTQRQGQCFGDRMQDLVHSRATEIDLEHYENPSYYDTFNRAVAEASSRPLSIVGGLVGLIQSTLSGVAIIGLLLALDWTVPLILIAIAIPAVLVRAKYARVVYRWQRQATPAQRQAAYFNWLLTGDHYAKEVRLFGLGAHFRERYQAVRRLLRNEQLDISARRLVASVAADSVGLLAAFAAFALMAYRALHGTITLGDLVMYYQAFQRGQGYIGGILQSLAGLYEDDLFLANLYEFLDLKPKVVDPPDPRPVPRPMRQGIVLDHVGFQYPTGTRPVLDDISLAIRPGEIVALVGANGAGKTTLVKLLCRLYDPSSGAITLDGADLRQYAAADLRREITVIFQDYARYHLTARENIRSGHIDLPLDDAGIEVAARQTGAHEVIAGLPKGYDTVLGKWFEDGEELSIGEWQKVALARAFLRDAQIIVLDEPTSAMDARAEAEVFSAFREIAKGRSAVLISHRFSTVRMADTIYVIDEGRVAEHGTHEELVRQGGTYAHLFEAQAQHYR